MRERLKRPADFTAVFAIADDMAIGAMRALRESGRSIPEDCSIIAIDGINVSEYIHPMLTTLCQPMTAMGTKSVELLLGVIRGGAPPPPPPPPPPPGAVPPPPTRRILPPRAE